MDIGIPPQPGQLALGVLPGTELHQFNGLRLCQSAVQHPQKLLVADGLHGGGIPGQSHGQQGTNLVQQPLLHHLVHPAVDECLHVGPVGELQADPYRVIPGRDNSGGGIVSGDGAAGFPVDLQRPEDPLCVGRVEALSAFRIYLPQLFQQGGDALPLKPGLQFPADGTAGAAPAAGTGGTAAGASGAVYTGCAPATGIGCVT